jgi:riboflavin synthase
MFTGLIETVGTVTAVTARGNYRVLTVAARFDGDALQVGESIACDGACLTVTAFDNSGFSTEASQETAQRSIIKTYTVGSEINLERALQLGDRLGGHLVSGHVDDVGSVDYLRPVGESLELALEFDPRYDPLVIEKGSLAVNGVSLTINSVRSGWCSLNLIPLTAETTTLRRLAPGRPVNLEFDLIGKYVVKSQAPASSLTKKKLLESGW